MSVASAPLFKLTRITADAVIKAEPGKIWAIQLNGGTDASSLKFYNDVDSAGGTQVIEVVAPFTDDDASAQDTVFISYVDLGGIAFDTGIYCDWTGTAAVGYVWTS